MKLFLFPFLLLLSCNFQPTTSTVTSRPAQKLKVTGESLCSETTPLPTPVKLAGVVHQSAFICTNGYIGFGDVVENLVAPDDLLEDVSSLIVAPFLIAQPNLEAKLRIMIPVEDDFAPQVAWLAPQIPTWDAEFTADIIITADWQRENFYHRVFIIEDNDYKNSGLPKLLIFVGYFQLDFDIDTSISQYARVGMNGPNFG